MEFSKLTKQYKDLMLSDPIDATNSGIHKKDKQFSDHTKKSFFSDVKEAKKLLVDASKVDVKKLNFNQKIDLDIIKLALERVVFSTELKYNSLYDFEQKPDAGSTIIDSMLYLFLKDPRSSIIRLDAINSRFGKIPSFLQDYKKTLKKTVDRWKDIEIEELQGVVDLFDNIMVWAKKEKYVKLDLLEKNITLAKVAIDDYLKYLNNLEVLSEFKIGKSNAQKLVKLNGIDLTLDEIYEIAKNFFIDHNKKITSLVSELKQKYNLDKKYKHKDVLDFIKQKFSIPITTVVSEYKRNQKEITKFLKKTGYFVLPKSDKLIIIKTPSYLVPSIPVGAMFPPAPFEKGPKTSTVYLTIDEGRHLDQNSLMITNTMIHEGIPGHHLQFAVGYENKSVVRKLANYNTHAEGWTTYLEGFMSEVGFIDNEILSEYNLIALSDFARLGARVAIDLYFMTGETKYLEVIKGFTPKGDTSIDKAKSLLIKATGFTDARAEGELNWYSKIRGYPMCYLIGNKTVWKLQKEVLNNAKDKEKALQEFHKIYLCEGPMPIRMLKHVLENKKLI